jgi:hypothetical protein
MGMAYDAARGEVVLFGGKSASGGCGDTWTWDSKNWRIPFKAHVHLSPNSGPAGTSVTVTGAAFAAFEQVTITFVDSVVGKTVLGMFPTDATGDLMAQVAIPANSTVGPQKIKALGSWSYQKAKATFTVT